jgi:16S rRNA processing protein RimM
MKQQNSSAAEGKTQTAGSSAPDEPVLLVVGKFRRPHGIGGEILFEVLTDFPERLQKGKRLLVGDSQTPVIIEAARHHNSGLLFSIEGVADRETASRLTNQVAFVRADEIPQLDDDRYYHHELLGMTVVDETGNPLGIVGEILPTGANDVLVVVDANGNEQLLPMIDEVVKKIDQEKQELIVKPLEWL